MIADIGAVTRRLVRGFLEKAAATIVAIAFEFDLKLLIWNQERTTKIALPCFLTLRRAFFV